MLSFIMFLLCQQDEIEQLKKKIAELEEAIRKVQEDPEKLRKKVKQLEEEIEKIQEERQKEKEKGGAQQERLNLLNPAITVFLNGAARFDDERVIVGEGDEAVAIDDKIFFRGAELDFRAAVDPFVDAVLIIAAEEEATGEFAAEVEEGYGIIKKLPFLDEMPLGLRIKAGRYRAPLGLLNTVHLHDLPWTTRPEAIVEYLGSESGSFFEAGYAMEGAGLLFRLPSFEDTSLDFEFHVARPDRIGFTEGNDGKDPAFLTRLSFFWRTGEETDLSFGLSNYFEGGSLSSWCGIFDFMFRWKPVGEFRSLIVGGEIFYVGRESVTEIDDGLGGTIEIESTNSPVGYFLYAQYQISWHFYAGIRFDHVESLDDDELDTNVFGAWISYYTSEYFRVRLGYEYRNEDFVDPVTLKTDDEKVNTVLLELNFVFGAHPPEPWWVNR